MLGSLFIENIAVIEKASIEFTPGLNIMTGETGAGKSIVIDSLGAVLGERVSRELIRSGAASASVSAVFYNAGPAALKKLGEAGFEPDEDGNVIIQRVISEDGKNLCRINGCPASVSILKDVGSDLINIHGQHDSQELLNPDRHYRYLDATGGYSPLLSYYKSAYKKMRALQKELAGMDVDESEKERRAQLLRFQIEELEAAGIRVGEKDGLTARRAQINNSEKIIAALRAAYELMQGGDEAGGAAELTRGAASSLGEAARYFEKAAPLAAKLEETAYLLEECAYGIRGFFDELEYDPAELAAIEERLDALYRLGRKYGDGEEKMLEYLENAREELERLTSMERDLAALELEFKAADEEARRLALELSDARKKAAARLAAMIKEELVFLDMPRVAFEVGITPLAGPGPSGADKIEFLISTNPGEPPKPLAKIASGGELSRVMLAVKNVLAGADGVDTLIFDEIDSGVSGRAAQKIGLKLKQVSNGRQVICVTHLAQIAAQAHTHLLIQKNIKNGRTFTDVKRLDFDGRKHELARIMGGLEITDLMLQNAQQMLENA